MKARLVFAVCSHAAAEVCGKLVHLDLPCVDAEAKDYFRNVLDHARHVEEMVGGLEFGKASVPTRIAIAVELQTIS